MTTHYSLRTTLTILLLAFIAPIAWANDNHGDDNGVSFTSGDLTYRAASGEAYVSGRNDDNVINIIIPASVSYEGTTYAVKGILGTCFQGLTIETVEISKDATGFIIDKNEFLNCDKLYYVNLGTASFADDSQNTYFSGCESIRDVVTFNTDAAFQSKLIQATASSIVSVSDELHKPTIHVSEKKAEDARIRLFNSFTMEKETHFASFVSDTNADFDNCTNASGTAVTVEAYVAHANSFDSSKNQVTLSRVHQVPANTPVFVWIETAPDVSTNYNVATYSGTPQSQPEDNYTRGTINRRYAVAAGDWVFALNKRRQEDVLMQVPNNNSSGQPIFIPPYITYLDINSCKPSAEAPAPVISIGFDQDPTGMKEVIDSIPTDGRLYLINGTPAPEGYKGIAVTRGKLLYIK